MCFGAQRSYLSIQSLIEDIANTYPSVIFIAAAGNEGPSIGTVLFPAWLPQVIAISTLDILSSKGPDFSEESKLLSIKPDFVLEGSSSTSIAAARVVGFLSTLNRFDHRGQVFQFLQKYTEILEDFTIFEQGYGQLNLQTIKHQIAKISSSDKQELFNPLLHMYPSIIDLRMKQPQSIYWEPLREQIVEDENDVENQWVCGEANWSILILNMYLKQINILRIDKIGQCSINASVQPSQIQENKPIERINLILEKDNEDQFENTEEMEMFEWEECTFKIVFEVFEEYSHEQIQQTSNLNELKLTILNDQSVPRECQLEEVLTLKALVSTFYQQKYSFNTPSFVSHMRHHTKVSHLCQTSLPLSQLQSSYWDLLLLAQINRDFLFQDQQFLLQHLRNPGKILILLGSSYTSVFSAALYNIQSLNKFLKLFGVSFSQGQFSGEICFDGQNKYMIFKNGCEITLSNDNHQQLESVSSITLHKAILQDNIQNRKEKEIIYSAEIITSFSSVILLISDNSCLLERYLHKNCFHLINHSIDLAQKIKNNSIKKYKKGET